MNRINIVFFGDSTSFISTILFNSLIKFKDPSINISAVVDTALSSKKPFLYHVFSEIIKCVFNKEYKYHKYFKPFTSIAKKHKIKIYKPKSINDPNFVNEIKLLKPDFALSFGNPQIFKKDLIECFKLIINYHNSLLPKYRGLYATSWSMYFNEKTTGYTYHIVNEGIDDGDVILQEEFDIDYSKTPYEIELIKTYRAASKINELLNMLKLDNIKTKKQVGERSYFGKNDLIRLQDVGVIEIEKLNLYKKIINCFGGIYINYKGDKVYVTKIGNHGEVLRVKYLPPWLYLTLRKIKLIRRFVKWIINSSPSQNHQ